MTKPIHHVDAGGVHPIADIEYMIAILVYTQDFSEDDLRAKGEVEIRRLFNALSDEEEDT